MAVTLVVKVADSVDELYVRWRSRRDPASTLALCEALRADRRPELVEAVGEYVRVELADNVAALLSTARLFLDSGRLADAQTALVAAGKVAPRDAAVYRWLGEVLLRRGDAERAEKVFERAISFGASDPMTRMWLERSIGLKSLQAAEGARRVADEILRMAPPPAPSAVPPPLRPNLLDDEEEDPTAAHRRTSSRSQPPPPVRPAASMTFGGPPLVAAEPPPMPARGNAPALRRSTAAMPKPQMAPPPPSHVPAPPPPSAGPPRSPLPPPLPNAGPPPASPLAARGGGPMPGMPGVPGMPGAVAPPAPPPVASGLAGGLRNGAGDSAYRAPNRPGPENMPEARVVLDALALGGVFDPEHAAQPVQWAEATDKPRTFGTKRTIAGMALFAAISAGIFFFVKHQRDKAHLEAEAILDKVTADVDLGQAATLDASEQSLGKVFELDSRSPRGALVWLHERAMRGLLRGGAEISFQDATVRALEVKVPESEIAFAYAAGFLFQGDTAGAAGVLAKWDDKAQNDAYYQLIAGATLERAGDPRAADRYLAATKLNPKLVVARVAYLRSMAMDGDPRKAKELADQFKAEYPARPESSALLALAWARDYGRPEAPPPDVAATIAKAAELPISLAALPSTLRAMDANEKHDLATAKTEIGAGIGRCDTPSCATWLGLLATDVGDEGLARRAALAALAFSAQYKPARALAARVALLGGRLDEGLKATEDLDVSSPDVAIVRAATAYERCDVDLLQRTMDAIPPEARKLPVLAGFSRALEAMSGRPIGNAAARLELAKQDGPWADFVAMDNALDTGDLATARQIAELWKVEPPQPLRTLRLGRLARYDGKLDDADTLSAQAFAGSTVTPRSLSERVMVLVAKNKAHDAAVLVTKYPLVMGSQGGWLSAYVTAASGKLEDARGKTAALTVPSPEVPYVFRLVAAVALASLKDQKHAAEVLTPMMKGGAVNPDVEAAASALNMPKLRR